MVIEKGGMQDSFLLTDKIHNSFEITEIVYSLIPNENSGLVFLNGMLVMIDLESVRKIREQ